MTEPHGLSLNQQGKARPGRPPPGAVVLALEAIPLSRLARRAERDPQADRLGQRVVESLAGASQGRRRLGEDLTRGPLEPLSALQPAQRPLPDRA
ncbi:MAG: hypothetical protein ACREJ9_12875 [Candidatus Rokuibacteriota bacterium]